MNKRLKFAVGTYCYMKDCPEAIIEIKGFSRTEKGTKYLTAIGWVDECNLVRTKKEPTIILADRHIATLYSKDSKAN